MQLYTLQNDRHIMEYIKDFLYIQRTGNGHWRVTYYDVKWQKNRRGKFCRVYANVEVSTSISGCLIDEGYAIVTFALKKSRKGGQKTVWERQPGEYKDDDWNGIALALVTMGYLDDPRELLDQIEDLPNPPTDPALYTEIEDEEDEEDDDDEEEDEEDEEDETS